MNDLLNRAKLQITERITELLDGYVKGILSERDLDELGYLLTSAKKGLRVMEDVGVDTVKRLWRPLV